MKKKNSLATSDFDDGEDLDSENDTGLSFSRSESSIHLDLGGEGLKKKTTEYSALNLKEESSIFLEDVDPEKNPSINFSPDAIALDLESKAAEKGQETVVEEISERQEKFHKELTLATSILDMENIEKEEIPRETELHPLPRLNINEKQSRLFAIIISLFSIPTFGFSLFLGKIELKKQLFNHLKLGRYQFNYFGERKIYLRSLFMVVPIFLFLFQSQRSLLMRVDESIYWAVALISIQPALLFFGWVRYGCFRYTINRLYLEGIPFLAQKSGYRCYSLAFAKMSIFSVLSLGLYVPFMLYYLEKLKWENCQYGLEALDFFGSRRSTVRIFYKGFFLSFLTLGLYVPFLVFEWNLYRFERMRMSELRFYFTGIPSKKRVFLFKQSLLFVLSCGLLLPWIVFQQHVYILKNSRSEGVFDFEGVATHLLENRRDFEREQIDSLGIDGNLI